MHMPHLGTAIGSMPSTSYGQPVETACLLIAKWARTAEGYMCPPTPQGRWITGIASQTECTGCAWWVVFVLTGVGTVKADDCRLNRKLYTPRQIPMVAVASRSGPIPQSAALEQPEQHSAHRGNTSGATRGAGQDEHPSGAAGSRMTAAYWQSGLIDEAWVFVGPVSMPDGSNPNHQSPNPRETLSLHHQGATMSFGPDRIYRLPIAAN